MHIRSFGEMGNAVGLRMVLRVGIFAFLMANLWYRFWTVFDYSRFVGALFVFLAEIRDFKKIVMCYQQVTRCEIAILALHIRILSI